MPVRPAIYRKVASVEENFADMKARGIGRVSQTARSLREASEALARRFGMKHEISLPDATRNVGGAYRGQAIDRRLFRFHAGPREIETGPPAAEPAERGWGK